MLSDNILMREISELRRLSFRFVGLDKIPLVDTVRIHLDVAGFVVFAPESLMFCGIKCTFSYKNLYSCLISVLCDESDILPNLQS